MSGPTLSTSSDDAFAAITRQQSMELPASPSSKVNLKEQKAAVIKQLCSNDYFNQELMKQEIEWFYDGLGLHEFYFSGHSVDVIANHIQSLFAAKVLSLSSGNAMDVNLEQKDCHSAFFATRSNVQGSARIAPSQGESQSHHESSSVGVSSSKAAPSLDYNSVELLEYRIEKSFLSNTEMKQGTGTEPCLDVEEAESRHYRLQCYRSDGVLDPVRVPAHIRMYFLQKPEFVNPTPRQGELDIEQLADRRFLARAGENLKRVYQHCLNQTSHSMIPVYHTETWVEPDQSNMGRLVIAYRTGATHSYFCGIANVYRAHGLYSSRKYVEYFSNGIVIFSLYLQELHGFDTSGRGSFDDRLDACVSDASMHFILPRTSLTPLLRQHLLSPMEYAYAYAAWKFTFHFLHRLPEAYTVIAESLRIHDPSALSRLAQLRNSMKLNTYTEEQIKNEIMSDPLMVKRLYRHFETLHAPASHPSQRNDDPAKNNATEKTEVESLMRLIRKGASNSTALATFTMFCTFNQHIKRTNFFQIRSTLALAFRLDGDFLSQHEFNEKPFAIIYVIGSEFRGFHVRFLDISRGGIRMIRSASSQVYALNVSSLFDECYSLASTQQRKNKDIPEGGSKGVILLNEVHQNKATVAFKKYIDALLDIMLPAKGHAGTLTAEEILFLGPDEGTAELMDWASSYAKSRKYRYWKAITTGKSATRGGIPHDVYGMTTHSVRQYVSGITSKLGLAKDLTHNETTLSRMITKVQTGGPDGDLGSNEILMSQGEETTVAIVDGSGVLYDPAGINATELARLATARQTIASFSSNALGPDGYVLQVTQNEVTLPDGEGVENGLAFRNGFHLRQNVSADFFVPCGGRPNAVNLDNVDAFMYGADGKTLRFKYIVEGANLFFTQDARLMLEAAGVILFKDASANKGGVTSSSLEVMAAMVLDDVEFQTHMCVSETGVVPEFYAKYVAEVQTAIDVNAAAEFECLWREHASSRVPFSELSNRVSEKITTLTINVQTSHLWDNLALRTTLLECALPKCLVALLSREVILKRLPESYTRAVFASQLASRFIYQVGLAAPEFAFYEFVQSLSLSAIA